MSTNGKVQSALRLAAAESIGERLEKVRSRMSGVLQNTDIEDVHQMRVASRRLRVALRLFAPALPARQAATWGKAIRRVTRALGAARDLDVQHEFVQSLRELQTDRTVLPGLDRLLLRLQQQRDTQQHRVAKAIARLEASGVLEAMSRFSRELVARAQLEPVPPQNTTLAAHAADAILDRLQALLAYEAFVEMPDRIAEHHAMRIAAKRLRYTLEVFTPTFAGELRPFLKSVKQIQTLLGDLHDCDVWIEKLPQFLDDERRRTIEYQGHGRGFNRLKVGVEHLIADRTEQRRRVYEEFVKVWRATRKDQTWRNLLVVVNARANPVAPPDPVAASPTIEPSDAESAPQIDAPSDEEGAPIAPPSQMDSRTS